MRQQGLLDAPQAIQKRACTGHCCPNGAVLEPIGAFSSTYPPHMYKLFCFWKKSRHYLSYDSRLTPPFIQDDGSVRNHPRSPLCCMGHEASSLGPSTPTTGLSNHSTLPHHLCPVGGQRQGWAIPSRLRQNTASPGPKFADPRKGLRPGEDGPPHSPTGHLPTAGGGGVRVWQPHFGGGQFWAKKVVT